MQAKANATPYCPLQGSGRALAGKLAEALFQLFETVSVFGGDGKPLLPRKSGFECLEIHVGFLEVDFVCHNQPGALAQFLVVKAEFLSQDLDIGNGIALIDGGFAFTPVGDGQTRVCLTTRYEPKLTPRVIWRPLEHRFAHDLHRHVLAGMEDRLAGQLAAGDREGSGDR